MDLCEVFFISRQRGFHNIEICLDPLCCCIEWKEDKLDIVFCFHRLYCLIDFPFQGYILNCFQGISYMFCEYSGVAEPCFPLKEPPTIPVKRANLSANESQ